jgi:hypothetical protein
MYKMINNDEHAHEYSLIPEEFEQQTERFKTWNISTQLLLAAAADGVTFSICGTRNKIATSNTTGPAICH